MEVITQCIVAVASRDGGCSVYRLFSLACGGWQIEARAGKKERRVRILMCPLVLNHIIRWEVKLAFVDGRDVRSEGRERRMQWRG